MTEPPAGQRVGGLTSEEEALRQACLRIQNDPRLSASEKRRQVSVLAGEGFGEMSSAELYGRHSREKG
jgi:hypothetical protein